MSHEGLHEPAELLGEGTRNLHRALVSLIEELEAIDWYQQRADACSDPALKAVLLHNRNEEVEHGMMTLEWLRRNDATFDKFLHRYLFKDADIIAIEEAADEEEERASRRPRSKPRRTTGRSGSAACAGRAEDGPAQAGARADPAAGVRRHRRRSGARAQAESGRAAHRRLPRPARLGAGGRQHRPAGEARRRSSTREVHVGIRQAQPLVELRVPIRLPIAELDSIARGAPDPDLRPVVAAAEKLAHVEDSAIFNGLPAAGIEGIIPASPHHVHKLPPDVTHLPRAILTARETLRQAGVSGPYALVLDAAYTAQVLAAAEDGYPLAKRLTDQVLDGPLIRAEAIEGGVLLSVRGGDYELTVGQDLSIGYAAHDPHIVELYLTESFTFRVLEAVAAVRMAR